MAPPGQPKVLLFDIGGVCVVSPFQAILNYEISHSIPPGWVNHSISRSAPNGFWHRLERGEILLDSHFFLGFASDLHNPTLWNNFFNMQAQKNGISPRVTPPPPPKIDAEFLFWEMMRGSRAMDPWMYPALLALKRSGRYIVAALSNTVIFPPSHPYSDPKESEDVRRLFDVFISSAHVGLRKPDLQIYELALKEVNDFARGGTAKGDGEMARHEEIKANEVLFLDDIGENLKAAKIFGFRTMKVNLGRAFNAVDELEQETGLALAGNHPRMPVMPIIPEKSKL